MPSAWGLRIKNVRENLGISQEDTARRVGISRQSYCWIETRGLTPPHGETPEAFEERARTALVELWDEKRDRIEAWIEAHGLRSVA